MRIEHSGLGVKEMTVSAVIVRKDGTREDVGVIAYTGSPLKRLFYKVGGRLRRWRHKVLS